MRFLVYLALAFAPIFAALPASAQDWSGGYAGGSIGYVFGDSLYCDDSAGAPYLCDDPDSGLPSPEPAGGVLGFTGGYDWQNGVMVYGVAADVLFGDLSDIAGSTVAPGFGCGGGICGLEINHIAMLRGRVGYAMGEILPYATAGVAVTDATAFTSGGRTADGSFTNFVIGAGVDYMLSDTLSAGFDVLHLVEGDDTIYIPGFCGGACGATNFSATIARVTLAYRF